MKIEIVKIFFILSILAIFPNLIGFNANNNVNGSNDLLQEEITNSGNILQRSLSKIDQQTALPELYFSTFFSGSGVDTISTMGVDSTGKTIIAGSTSSIDLPLVNSYSNTYSGGAIDGFLAKFSTEGQLLYSSYFGGSAGDSITSLIVDESDNIIIVGETYSNDLPITNAYKSNNSGLIDIFLAKFSSDGQTLIFSSYFGGIDDDVVVKALIDRSGNIVVHGSTKSSDFPTHNAYSNDFNGVVDGFLAKFSPDGQLLFSTYLGGSNNDYTSSAAIDELNNIILAGNTRSIDFPTPNGIINFYSGPFGEFLPRGDGFITKFSPDGQILFSTYLGGSSGDLIAQVELDNENNIFLTGESDSLDFPLLESFDSDTEMGLLSGGDVFLTKLSFDGQMQFSTFLGGSSQEDVSSLNIDVNGNILLGGKTNSPDFPLFGSHSSTFSGENKYDGFLAKFSNSGEPQFLTYLGGSSSDEVNSLITDHEGNIILTGQTNSIDFPVRNTPYRSCICGENKNKTVNIQEYWDAFLMKFSLEGELLYSTYFGGSSGDFITVLGKDQIDSIIIGGSSNSDDFPILNSYNINSRSNAVFLAKFGDFFDSDNDGMHDYWELGHGLDLTADDSQNDLDNDGIPNYWEYKYQLDPTIDDTLLDLDHDGLTNIQEYSINSNPNSEDTDEDGMVDGYEYYSGLNVTKNDASGDLDFDWVSNIDEYNLGTNVNSFLSFPLITPHLPYIITAPHVLGYLLVGIMAITGGVIGRKLKIEQRRKLLEMTGAPDFQTYLKMKEGNFTDYQIYLKAQELYIDTQEQYEFQMELLNQDE